MKQYQEIISHLSIHLAMWVVGMVLLLKYLKPFAQFIGNGLKEKSGKPSMKRIILLLFALGFNYAWLRSIHSGKLLDHYVITCIISFELLGLAIIMPDQMNTLLNNLKSFTNQKEEEK